VKPFRTVPYNPDKFDAAWRERVSKDAAGKTIESLTWEPEGDHGHGYWVMTFTDGTEICVRLMAEMC